MANASSIRIETVDGIGLLRFERPTANAMDLRLLKELEGALIALESSPETRALVITGSGNFFSAGLDLKVVPDYTPAEQRELVMLLNRAIGRLYGLPLPTVAAVNGHAIAGGLIVALACDYRIAAEGSYQLGLAEVRVGVQYPVAPMAVVQGELSVPVARVMVLTGRNSDPREAQVRGVLDDVVPTDRLLSRAREVALELGALPRGTYGRIKRQFRAAALAKIEDAIVNQNDPMLESWFTKETGLAAANALKRK